MKIKWRGLPDPSMPFGMALCGKKKSGKNHLLLRMLLDYSCLRGRFEDITIVSPTFRLSFHTCWNKLDPSGIRVFETFDEKFVDDFLEYQTLNSKKHSLLIIDDCSEMLRKIPVTKLGLIFQNHRHIALSFIHCAQKVTQMPTQERSSLDTIVCFGSASFQEREALWRESSAIPRKEFFKLFSQATEKEHSFLVCSVIKGKLRFFSDFRVELFP